MGGQESILVTIAIQIHQLPQPYSFSHCLFAANSSFSICSSQCSWITLKRSQWGMTWSRSWLTSRRKAPSWDSNSGSISTSSAEGRLSHRKRTANIGDRKRLTIWLTRNIRKKWGKSIRNNINSPHYMYSSMRAASDKYAWKSCIIGILKI
jgi:hypothetical protein